MHSPMLRLNAAQGKTEPPELSRGKPLTRQKIRGKQREKERLRIEENSRPARGRPERTDVCRDDYVEEQKDRHCEGADVSPLTAERHPLIVCPEQEHDTRQGKAYRA